MWIQPWKPRYRWIRYAIWREHEGLYLSVWRSEGPGHTATLIWDISSKIERNHPTDTIYQPSYHHRILFTNENYRLRSRQLKRDWEKIMADPSAFLMEQLL